MYCNSIYLYFFSKICIIIINILLLFCIILYE